jgi:uncharacterized membrane protein YbhN (UPF0104 family)
MPGGAAVGAAVQFRMLAVSGTETGAAVSALASYSLLGVGGLLALPVLALPVILVGAPANRGLVNAALLGAAGFVVFAALGGVVLAYDAPLRWAGGAVQWAANLLLRKRPALTGVGESLVAQRDEIRAVLGSQWWQALLLSAGRLAFDYLCLLAALRATGSRPRPSLILVAYAAAGIVGMIPVTPGGLGLVEASLSGLLVLAQAQARRCWRRSATGSPRTGPRCVPGRSRTACSASGTGAAPRNEDQRPFYLDSVGDLGRCGVS